MTTLTSPSPDVHCLTASNGLGVNLLRANRLPYVALNLTYGVGSGSDPLGLSGLAHLVEHLTFQPRRNGRALDGLRRLSRFGGSSNAATDRERTSFSVLIPARQLSLALEIEAERMLAPDLEDLEAGLERQRPIVLAERTQRIDGNPFGRAAEIVSELLYPEGHPYRRPVIGYSEDIHRISAAAAASHLARHFHPGNAQLALVGDFDPEEAHSAIERFFGEFRSAPTASAPPSGDLPHRRAHRESIEVPGSIGRLYLAYPIPPYGSREWYAAELLGAVLARGQSGLLVEELVEKRRLALDIRIQAVKTRLSGSWWLIATARPGVAVDELRAGIDRKIEDLREGSLDADEVEGARRWLASHRLHEEQLLGVQAERLALYAAFFGGPNEALREPVGQTCLTAFDLRAFAAASLAPEASVAVSVVPAGGGPGTTERTGPSRVSR